jgi:hypothetical protein
MFGSNEMLVIEECNCDMISGFAGSDLRFL